MNKINLTNIKNIIFDLGGVVLNLDYNKSVNAFKDLGIPKFEEIYSQAYQSNLFDDLEKGKIEFSVFREAVREIADRPLSDKAIDDAWNAMLLDVPPHRITFLEELKNTHRTFLLSNTNAFHFETYTKYLQQTYGISGLDHLFEKTYLSHELGMNKPNVEIFEFVIRDSGLNPAETVFIDDTERHILGAQKAGLQTYFLQKGEDIINIFE